MCDPKQPPVESGLPIERGQREIQLEENLLQHIRGLFAVLQHPADIAEQWILVAIYQSCKGALVACKGLFDQNTIRDSWHQSGAGLRLLHISHILLPFQSSYEYPCNMIPCGPSPM